MIAYFNGEYLEKDEITISPDDRGFLFADGLYEVIRAYRKKLFRAKDHIDRLNAGAAHLRLGVTDFSDLEGVAETLLEKNELKGDATVYFQITRGVAPRGHAFPDPSPAPTVFASAALFDPTRTVTSREDGIPVITVPDNRWARCDMKTVALTANVLANQEAVEKGAKEALFVRDGVIMEGTHSNFFAVMDGCLVTAPASNYILHGITRKVILELAAEKGLAFREGPVFRTDLDKVTEAFITGTTTEITPVVSIDGASVGTGAPGPVTRTLQDAFTDLISDT
ncbi:MAG: D-amino-acid transaminase [Desulfobacter sp.]|nr:MAG: D-amino-acid transaminase [Desulfobacter sp.]